MLLEQVVRFLDVSIEFP
jgi:hypothetical protein